jgi:hypothetical protein
MVRWYGRPRQHRWDDSERAPYRGRTSRGCFSHRPADCRAYAHPKHYDGVIAENGSDIRITTEATFTDNGTDIVLIFGSRGVFTGTTLDTVRCDKTSLLRIDSIDVPCPTP